MASRSDANSLHDVVVIGAGPAGEAAAELGGQATLDVVRMVYNTLTYAYGYKLAAADTVARLQPEVQRPMRLPSSAHRI
jgi:hypothetical protein